MKNRFIQMLTVICAVILVLCAVSVCAAAEETAATPTDLTPGTGESGEEIADSIEIRITKAVRIGETWSGLMKKTKPAVLKLDLDREQQIHVLVTGKDIWVSVEKSDRVTENPARTLTDAQTDQAVVSWYAEAGSYLITVGPVEPNLMGKAQVVIMDSDAFAAWEAEQAADPNEPTEEPGEEPEAEPEGEQPENEPEEENKPKPDNASERHISIEVTCDSPNPVIGDTAHFHAILHGYDELRYTAQWQYSEDRQFWQNIEGATDLDMDVVTTKINNKYYWRIVIYIEDNLTD